MAYPEPSISDHGAPYNEEDFVNEDGEDDVRCGCTRCKRRRLEAFKEESGYYDDKWHYDRISRR